MTNSISFIKSTDLRLLTNKTSNPKRVACLYLERETSRPPRNFTTITATGSFGLALSSYQLHIVFKVFLLRTSYKQKKQP